jgi:hypothetical protein
MAAAVSDHRERFNRIVSAHSDWNEALVAVLADAYDLTEAEVVRQRLLVSEIGRVGTTRSLPREEAARSAARTATRDLEYAWGTFLARGMQQGLIPEGDPRLLTRAVLGLYTSIWHWYRPGGALTLADIGRFYVGKQLSLLGADPALAQARFPVAA